MSEVKPVGEWDIEAQPDVVWATRLDDRYLIEVVASENPYKGQLRVFDKEQDFTVLLDEPTGIAYGAPFGPDVDDVARWQERVLEVVDV